MADPEHPPLSSTEGRKRTDLLILVLFVVFNLGMIALAGYSFSQGDVVRVTNGISFKGCTCGTTECVGPNSPKSSLGELTIYSFPYSGDSIVPTKLPSLSACATTCKPPKATAAPSGLLLFCGDKFGGATWAEGNGTAAQMAYLEAAGCAADDIMGTYAGTEVSNYCLPFESKENDGWLNNLSSSEVASRQWSDLMTTLARAKWVILACCLLSLLVGFVYLWGLKHCARVLTWGAIFAVFVLLIAAGAFLLISANRQEAQYDGASGDAADSDPAAKFSHTAGIILLVMAAIYACLVCFLFRRVMLALDMIESAALMLHDTPYIVLLPVWLLLGGLAMVALWTATSIMLYSTASVVVTSSSAVPGGSYYHLEPNNDLRYAFIYHFFGLLWNVQFLVAVAELTVSFVVVAWFFAPRSPPPEQRKVITTPVSTAFNLVFHYHLGTAAFGALVIAIIKAIRATIAALRARARAHPESQASRWVLCLCSSCFWLLDRCMRFINKNAYTVTALSGKSFCPAAFEAFSMIVANAVRMATLNSISTIFLAFGKWFVALVPTAACYAILVFDPTFGPDGSLPISSPFFPALVVFLFSYTAGALFMSVYDMAIDAMLLVYIYDESHDFLDPTTKADIGLNIGNVSDQCNAALGPDAHGFSADDQEEAKRNVPIATRPAYEPPSAK